MGAVEYSSDIERRWPRLNIEKVLGDAVVHEAEPLGQSTRSTAAITTKYPKASWPGMLLQAHVDNLNHQHVLARSAHPLPAPESLHPFLDQLVHPATHRPRGSSCQGLHDNGASGGNRKRLSANTSRISGTCLLACLAYSYEVPVIIRGVILPPMASSCSSYGVIIVTLQLPIEPRSAFSPVCGRWLGGISVSATLRDMLLGTLLTPTPE